MNTITSSNLIPKEIPKKAPSVTAKQAKEVQVIYSKIQFAGNQSPDQSKPTSFVVKSTVEYISGYDSDLE